MISDKNLFKTLFLIQVSASFLVFMGHYAASASTYITQTLWESALRHLSSYGTVLLAMLTGFFTAHSFEGKKVSASRFFQSKLFLIYLPFLFFGVVYHYALHGGLPRYDYHFERIFLGKTGAHLYFIFMLCQYYVFAYLFKSIITKKTCKYFLILFMVIQFLFTKLVINWNGLGVRHFLLTWIFTIYLGHFLYWHREEVINWILKTKAVAYSLLVVSVSSVVFFTFSSKLYTANHLIFVLLAFVLLLTGIRFLLPISGHFERVRFRKGLTMYIYFAHSFFIILANNYVLKKLGFLWVLENKLLSVVYMLSIYFVTFLFSYTWTGLIQKYENLREQAKQKSLSTAL